MKTNDNNRRSQQANNQPSQMSAHEEVKYQITTDKSKEIPTECTDINSTGLVISETKKNDTLALTNYL